MKKIILPVVIIFITLLFLTKKNNREPFSGRIIDLNNRKTEFVEKAGLQKEKTTFKVVYGKTKDTVLASCFMDEISIKGDKKSDITPKEKILSGENVYVTGYTRDHENFIKSIEIK